MSVVPDGVEVGYFVDEYDDRVIEVSGVDKIDELVQSDDYPYIVYWSKEALQAYFLGRHRVVLGYDQYGREVEDEESLGKAKSAYDAAWKKRERIA